jgi:hypothetical protein
LKNESIRLYKILAVLFIAATILLSLMNLALAKKNMNPKELASAENITVNNTVIEKYGYTEILKVLKKDNNLQVTNINNTIDNKNLIKIELKYEGSLESLYSTLERIKLEPCFLEVESIKVDKNENDKQSITLIVKFLVNK